MRMDSLIPSPSLVPNSVEMDRDGYVKTNMIGCVDICGISESETGYGMVDSSVTYETHV